MSKKFAINLLMAVLLGVLIDISMHGTAYSFHEGGVGYCEGCHSLHGSGSGLDETEGAASEAPALKGADPTSTCLRCHAEKGKEYNVFSKDGSMYLPGGDFYWLKKTFTWNTLGALNRSRGEKHGHNVIASEYGLNGEGVAAEKGNMYPPGELGCTSCHNPHGITRGDENRGRAVSISGSYGAVPSEGTISGNYRLLGGTGYKGGIKTGGFLFKYPAPVAAANQDDWTENDTNHVAYGTGMSRWCGNCHEGIVDKSNKHPSGSGAVLGGKIAANYNSYIKTGDISGQENTAYLSLVPFELGTSDKSLLDPSSTAGPEPGKANVMCLTCHRAHASAFESIGRWDLNATFMADSHPASGDGGVTGNDVLNSYYGREMAAEFGKYQRQLCNKCHAQD